MIHSVIAVCKRNMPCTCSINNETTITPILYCIMLDLCIDIRFFSSNQSCSIIAPVAGKKKLVDSCCEVLIRRDAVPINADDDIWLERKHGVEDIFVLTAFGVVFPGACGIEATPCR